MNKLAAIGPLTDLTVRFIGGPPIDEVVYWIRRCAVLRAISGPLTVVLQPRGEPSAPHYEVRLESPDQVLVTERDSNILLAVRNAFDGLLAIRQPHAVRARDGRGPHGRRSV